MFKNKGLAMFLVLFGLLFLVACSSSESSGTTEEEPKKEADSEGQLPEGYPDQTIEVLVGYGAGGGTDLSARNMIEALNSSGIVDQSFVVENITGAGGAIAMKELASSGDEYTLEAIPEYGSGLWNNTAGDLGLSDFTPIAQVATDYQIIAVREDSPYETIEELLDAMKEDSQSVTIPIASSLDGGEPWRWYQVADGYGIEGELNLVSLEGGNAALTALLGGDGDAIFVVPQLAADHIEKGNIRGLAVMTDERTDQFPDIPTLKEKGVDVTYYRTRGFWMSGNVSEEVANYWENAFKEMMETETWEKYIENSGLLPIFKGREEYTNVIAEDGAAYKEYFKSFDR
jgi:putative tricarboxylic transport membrane protein